MPASDFARLSAARGGDLAGAWQVFAHEAAFIAAKLATFGTLCREVRHRARAQDVREAAARYGTVILMGHWKGAVPLVDDIRDPGAVLAALQQPVPQGCAPAQLHLAALAAATAYVTGNPDASVHAAVQAAEAAQRRRWLDEAAGLYPGNLLELWGEMIAPRQFAALFPPGYQGTVYLMVCNSHWLGDGFRQSYPAAKCLCSRRTVWAGLSVAKLHAALILAGTCGLPLWEALLEAGDLMDQL